MIEHSMKVVHDLRAAEQIISLYYGPTTAIRVQMRKLIDERIEDVHTMEQRRIAG